MPEEPSSAADEARRFPDLHINRAHSARMYNYYLGGKDNYESDRNAAQAAIGVFPGIFTCALENRDFMHRATRVVAADHGITQWLDIGTGIPARPNLHEVAQSVVPHARIVYVDHDPIVLAHARALLSSTPEGRTAYVQADVTEPESILADKELLDNLDLTKPVALSLNALLHFIPDERDPYGIVRRLLDALPSGSALAISHCTPEFNPEAWSGITEIYTRSGTPVRFRTKSEVARFFDGLDLIEPGIVVGQRWRPDAGTLRRDATDADVSLWAGVAIKP
jgi:S-adenosyl methyltransferase